MCLSTFFSSWDHPRLRGEKYQRMLKDCQAGGSPPLTRGKEIDGNVYYEDAGKSFLCHDLRLTDRDHLRLHGEKIFVKRMHIPMLGSPPLTRGKVTQVQLASALSGITPAYAGKSQNGMAILIGLLGSPPLTRGKVYRQREYKSKEGITPAYAGKRYFSGKAKPPGGDHPRLRGEKSPGEKAKGGTLGSPPLTRGKDSKSG